MVITSLFMPFWLMKALIRTLLMERRENLHTGWGKNSFVADWMENNKIIDK